MKSNMSRSIKIGLGLIMAIHVLGFWIVVVLFARGGSGLEPGVTAEGIRSLDLGMSEAETIALLGTPAEVTKGAGWIVNPESGLARQVSPETITFRYFTETSPLAGNRWYPALWVHFESGRVSGVYAKRYISWGFDDIETYRLSSNEPQRWESPLFASTFAEN
jgi:hypothetical protein